MTARPHLHIEPDTLAEEAGIPHPPRELAVPQVDEDRARSIAEAAYYRAERRGFAPGAELEDWLAAEREIDALVRAAT
jgi:hypothetical protein